MSEKISKIIIESNDPTLVVDINKSKRDKLISYLLLFISVATFCSAAYILYLTW